jgi:hypothetical protein
MRSAVGLHAPMLLLVLLAASGCVEASPTPSCPGLGAPTVLEVTDLSPALGDSVSNDAIVHRFTLAEDIRVDGLALEGSPEHTAGLAHPALSFHHDPPSAADQFTADPITWATAPAHVEIVSPIVYQTDEGCAYQLPSPLFSYDVTPP